MKKSDFLLAGVGGQGVLTASDIVAEVGMAMGLDAKKSEIHGFSQRGGVVALAVARHRCDQLEARAGWRSDRTIIQGNRIHDGRDAIVWYSAGVKVQGNIDLYNVTNSGSVLADTNAFGARWLVPTLVLEPRILQFSAQLRQDVVQRVKGTGMES